LSSRGVLRLTTGIPVSPLTAPIFLSPNGRLALVAAQVKPPARWAELMQRRINYWSAVAKEGPPVLLPIPLDAISSLGTNEYFVLDLTTAKATQLLDIPLEQNTTAQWIDNEEV